MDLNTQLYEASRIGDLERVKTLLNRGAWDLDKALDGALYGNQQEVIDFIHQKKSATVLPPVKKSYVPSRLTGIKDVDVEILLQLDDRSLFNFFLSSKYGQYLSNYEPLWFQKVKKTFPNLTKQPGQTWKQLYLSQIQ